MKRYPIILLIALLLSSAACDRGEPGEVSLVPDAGRVRVSQAVAAESGVQVAARVVASQTAEIATRASGIIQSVEVDVGSRVREGQVLARLESSGVESAVAAAEAQATVASRTYQRISNLERDGAATSQELDQAEAGLRASEAMLQEARAARDYVTLRAPFAGAVSARYADPGDLAVPGRPILVISGSGGVKIEADVPADLADRVSVGEVVTVVRRDTGGRWSAKIERIVPTVDLATHRFRVEAAFVSGTDLPIAGSFARLQLAGAGDASAWVPADVLIRRGQLTGVFVAERDEIRLRWVRVGRTTGGAAEILAGLREGALVVREPEPRITHGAKIAATERVEWALSPEGGR